MERYKAKGLKLFRLSKDGPEIQTFDYDYFLKMQQRYHKDEKTCCSLVEMKYEYEFNFDIYDLIDGKEFINLVKNNCINDYDGHVANVFVDGFNSNLGLSCDRLTTDGFTVSEEVWSDICNAYDVKVNWANK